MLLHYEISGQGEPLVLLHGNGEKIATLQQQINDFSTKFKVIAIDSRAHGQSAMGNTPLSYELMMNDVLHVMNHLNIDLFSIFGFSDGAIIGLLLALNHPERVSKLVAVGANAYPSGLKTGVRIGIYVQRLRYQWRMIRGKGGKRKYWLMNLMLKEPHFSKSELQQIKTPTLLLAGESDMIKYHHSLMLHQNMPNSSLRIIKNADHFLPHKHADIIDPIVLNWL